MSASSRAKKEGISPKGLDYSNPLEGYTRGRKGYIIGNMKTKLETMVVVYKCFACGSSFPAPQGSRRYYCDKCRADRVKTGKKIKESER